MLQRHIMEKSLAIYPIPIGNDLNIFTSNPMCEVKIMDMSGEVLVCLLASSNQQHTVNISALPSATYIVEVLFTNNKTSRSVFIKV